MTGSQPSQGSGRWISWRGSIRRANQHKRDSLTRGQDIGYLHQGIGARTVGNLSAVTLAEMKTASIVLDSV